MYFGDAFGRSIRGHREGSELSREKFAELCGVSDRCIFNIENGKAVPKLDTALAICQSCQIDAGELARFYAMDEDILI